MARPGETAATSATPWTTLSVWSLIGTRNAGLFVAFLVVSFGVVGNRAFDGFGCHAHVIVVTRRAALTRFTTAAPAAAALAAVAVRFALTGDRFLGAGDFVA